MKKVEHIKMLPWRRPRNWIDNINSILLNVKYKRQRMVYGVSRFDTFNFDNYLLEIFKNGLSSIKENSISYPYNLTEEEWNNVLNRMIELCEIMTNFYEANYENYDLYLEETEDAKNEFFDLMKEYFWHLWD